MSGTEVTLPVDKDTFKDFVRAILGKPQTISQLIFGSFELKIDDLVDIFQIVDQRVHQQNKASLIQFSTKMVYSDNSTRLLSSLEELGTFSEPRDVIPVAVHLEIGYLIRFVDDKSPDGFGKPEKQEINISIATSGMHKFKMVNFDSINIFPFATDGYFEIIIKHTAISWGADIESLLTKHLKTHLNYESKIKKFIRTHSGNIGLVIGASLFATSILFSILNTTNIERNRANEIIRLLDSVNNETINAINLKLNFIIEKNLNAYAVNQSLITVLFVVFSLIFSVFLGIWVGSVAENSPASYLLFNKEAEKQKKFKDKKISRKWMSFFVSLIVSIATGIASNYLFTFLCNTKIK